MTRPYVVTIKHLLEFSLTVEAEDEDKATEKAFAMQWPDWVSTIQDQECSVKEAENVVIPG